MEKIKDFKVVSKFSIEIDGKTVELTRQEASRLYMDLKDALGIQDNWLAPYIRQEPCRHPHTPQCPTIPPIWYSTQSQNGDRIDC